jgi:nitroreductase
MEFQAVVRRRKMVRSFTTEPVDPAVLALILENATHAPSAGFSQGWAFLVLDQPDDLARFWEVNWPDRERAARSGLFNAPVVIVPIAHRQAYLDRYAEPDKGWTDRDERRWPIPFWTVDTAFAAMTMLLTVVDQGLGALFFGFPDVDRFRAAFGIPDGYQPIGAIALGHPAEDRPSPSLKRGRRSLDDVVHYGRFDPGRYQGNGEREEKR